MTKDQKNDATDTGKAGDDELLTLTQAAQFLDVSNSTVYRFLDQGKLRAFKVGRQWRFRRRDLDAYLRRSPASYSEAPPDELERELAFFRDRVDLDRWPITCEERAEHATADSTEKKVRELVLLIIAHAFVSHASDIHLDPFGKGSDAHVLLRLRVDGVLQEARRFAGALRPVLTAGFKALADLDLLQTRLPQNGRIPFTIGKRNLHLRVATVPSFFGETLTGRLLDTDSALLSLDQLGLTPDMDSRFRTWLGRRHGLVLVTGPTGSGKTTVLYSLAREVTNPNVKVISVEDPVEYVLPGTIQIQVQEKMGWTIAGGLQSAMHHDPDVLLVADVRDGDVLYACCQAALTGHLVLGQMHADDAVSALTRLRDWGVEPFLLGSALTGISCQRLVRRLCKHCSAPDTPSDAMLERIRAAAGQCSDSLPDEPAFKRPIGCDQCYAGYRGRAAIHELLETNDQIREALLTGAARDQLLGLAIQSGMRTLAADGMRAAACGVTSLSEAFRVLR